MLLIKNGSIVAENLSFSLPEGMFFFYDMDTYAEDRLRFSNKEKTIELDIHIVKYKKDYSIEYLVNHESFITTSELLTVNRGGLSGRGIFYRNRVWSYEYYEEQLEIAEGYIASIRVICEVAPNTRDRIKKVFWASPIKDFFANIKEYNY